MRIREAWRSLWFWGPHASTRASAAGDGFAERVGPGGGGVSAGSFGSSDGAGFGVVLRLQHLHPIPECRFDR